MSDNCHIFDASGGEADRYAGTACCGNCRFNARRLLSGSVRCTKPHPYGPAAPALPEWAADAPGFDVEPEYRCSGWQHF